jgi:hypothetical protein
VFFGPAGWVLTFAQLADWLQPWAEKLGAWVGDKLGLTGIWPWIKEKLQTLLGDWYDTIVGILTYDLETPIWDWIYGVWDDIKAAFGWLWETISAWWEVESPSKKGVRLGENVGAGFGTGMADSVMKEVEPAVQGWFDSIVGQINKAFDNRSPSRKMAAYGRLVARGFGVGLEEGAKGVGDSTKMIADQAMSGMDAVANKLRDRQHKMKDTGKTLGQHMADGIKDGIKDGTKSIDIAGDIPAPRGGLARPGMSEAWLRDGGGQWDVGGRGRVYTGGSRHFNEETGEYDKGRGPGGRNDKIELTIKAGDSQAHKLNIRQLTAATRASLARDARVGR